jgi:hypothetical protein
MYIKRARELLSEEMDIVSFLRQTRFITAALKQLLSQD